MAKRRYSRRGRRNNFATRVKKVLAKQIEKKSHLLSGGFDSVDYPGNITHLSPIAQGDEDFDRVGDQIYLTKVTMRGMVTAGDTTNKVRLVVFRWNSEGTPTIAKVIRNYQGTGSDLDFLRPVNHDNKTHITVLYDKWWRLNLASAEYSMNDVPFSFVRYGKRLGAKKIFYEEASTTPIKGGIYALAFSDSGAVANPSVAYEMEVEYTDL